MAARYHSTFWILFFGLFVSASCLPTDQHATNETRILYRNLLMMARNPNVFMFGHASDTWTGSSGGHAPYAIITNTSNQGWKYTVEQAMTDSPDELSDVKSVTGQYAAVIDFGMWQLSHDRKIILSHLIKTAHKRGVIATLSQHLYNPITGGRPWVEEDNGTVLHTVRRLLPGGDTNWKFQKNLDTIADLAHNLTDDQGKLIPVLYRPLHELNGDWFWWGLGNKVQNTEDDLKSFYRYIVTYLRDHKNVHNFLYVYSPDKFTDKTDYLKVYPGDDYVDVIATDFYYKTPADKSSDFHTAVKQIVEIAESRNKIVAVSEAGIFDNAIDKQTNFWNEKILDAIQNDPITRRIAYILTWANQCNNNDCSVWVPYKGHPAENDFRQNFFNNPMTLFGSDIPNMYK
ncbi:mannan endo-1,4-beta-mannosidase-like isoform X1 [Haliotis rufescens]|uniref:mannan endo-1,4-beta-mannosidase-like isoform X1 n=1 Tax=Haliotis rufescens TaxID=6454 RepID=UPI00201ECF46|nr:mannan endo-1,4-beta-mannosidase-like isoform X1 [Haliotis rufescens]